MAEQMQFDLPYRAAMGRQDFFLSPCNAVAVAGIDAWQHWPMAKMILIGPEGAGKTHLAHVFCAQAQATICAASDLNEAHLPSLMEAPALAIEDCHRIAGERHREELLFHLHNSAAARHAPLLLTARDKPETWGISLPDLDSRLRQSDLLRLEAPDDAALMAVTMKLAQDRGISLPASVLHYALPRMERSFKAVMAFVIALDKSALSEGKSPSLSHARAILKDTN
ncbi:DnaA/Hda family protein [Rhodobacteraceae bacterium XHP0102]|nr:DnaA/Hda family protein [Rhodobacteraceae bacterium XHP0102]